MVVCPSCHRSIKKRNYRRHVKDCVPSSEDIKHYVACRSSISASR